MNNTKEINISEESTKYDITATYHSDMKCQNYDARIIGITEADGRISVKPDRGCLGVFEFKHSDPDRVLVVAEMIKAFAEMAKKENKDSEF